MHCISLCTADRSLAAWVVNKFAVADVKAVGVAASVIPADAAGFVCYAAVTAIASGVESAMVIMVIIVHATGVIHKVVISVTVVFAFGAATVIVTPAFGVIASEFGAMEVVCDVVLFIITSDGAVSIFVFTVAVANTTQIICDMAIQVAVAVV